MSNEGSIPDLDVVRRERNRLYDPRCKCETNTKVDRTVGAPLSPPRIIYSNDCPLRHEKVPFLRGLRWVDRRWPYKDEPDEMKYPDGAPALELA